MNEDEIGDNPGSRRPQEEPEGLHLKIKCAKARGAKEWFERSIE